MKVILIVLDSVGIGAAPDAADYGDAGGATLQHIAESVSGLELPTLQKLGLGNIPTLLPSIPPIPGCPAVDKPLASFGAMEEASEGKDTITGHWEMCGLEIIPGFHNFPLEFPSFPREFVATFEKATGRPIIGNKAASGIAIIEELGEEHMRTGAWIAYTSADSVLQLAAHTAIIPLDELYRGCEIARKLCDPLKVGRVIARPFIGKSGAFERTEDRRDYAFTPEEPLITERLFDAGVPVYAVGKIEDIVAHRGITESIHSGSTEESQKVVEQFMQKEGDGFIFANFIDFDMLYGHRRDPIGYAAALRQTDDWLASFLPQLGKDDVLLLTADHGNDPTFKGTDHTREYVPLLAYRPGRSGESLGIRRGFYDIAQSLASSFGLAPVPRGESFLQRA
ncbi:phosphopentomutase [Pontiella sulfatireligans]|uniref:Phosphopentomutase n=1 Tax=Pontiella sulfatireligans TaxID=2750658 RepID=A0A6C2UP31_9BACT|nr:phosphopentomutase [Pontiella sulfatireligans]VGO21703.1 Phosphopentomutase [Pontiella sulfatireligans]